MFSSINNIGEFLKSKGVKPSFQRIKIFEYLIKKKNHPTVETIFQELSQEIPTLSKTTIYNTMDLFFQHELVSVLTIEENETRFDADVTLHGHFKCEKCGRIIDLDIDREVVNISALQGHQVNESHLYFKGICRGCRKDSAAPAH